MSNAQLLIDAWAEKMLDAEEESSLRHFAMTSNSNPQSEKRFPTPNDEVHFQTPDPTVNQNLDPDRLEETLHQHKENETDVSGDAAQLDTAIDDPAGADLDNPVDQQISSLGRTPG